MPGQHGLRSHELLHKAQRMVGRIAFARGGQHPQAMRIFLQQLGRQLLHGQQAHLKPAFDQHLGRGTGQSLGLPRLTGIGDQDGRRLGIALR